MFEYKDKALCIHLSLVVRPLVYMSTFDAGIGQIRGELNSYRFLSPDIYLVSGRAPLLDLKPYRVDRFSAIS
jgi:hypothetical protein